MNHSTQLRQPTRLKRANLLICTAIFAISACEVPAASETVEVLLMTLTPSDIDPRAEVIYAVASVNTGACVEGPCSPNPCLGDPSGLTACRGQGDQHMCVCPAGQGLDTEGGTNTCIPDTECRPSTCRGQGSMCMDEGGVLSCMCAEGWMGPNCADCDSNAGFYPDGLGGCTMVQGEICREGQGAAAFAKLIEDATTELGHPPTELELSSARLEISGAPAGVRSWEYLFDGDVTLILQTVSGFPNNAATLKVPPADTGLPPIEFDMAITRAVTSSDPQFMSGDFRVGISVPTRRQLTEVWSADLKLVLDFKAY